MLFVNVFGWVTEIGGIITSLKFDFRNPSYPKSTWKRCKNPIKRTPFAINLETFPYSDYYEQSYGIMYVLQRHFSTPECFVVVSI